MSDGSNGYTSHRITIKKQDLRGLMDRATFKFTTGSVDEIYRLNGASFNYDTSTSLKVINGKVNLDLIIQIQQALKMNFI